VAGYNGGSGIAILSHPTNYKLGTVTGANVVVSNVNSNIIYQFYSSGSITWI
jgi:hypothetical protein